MLSAPCKGTLYRGRKLLGACDDPVSVVLVFPRKLPNHQGVDTGTLVGDLQELKLVRKMKRRHLRARLGLVVTPVHLPHELELLKVAKAGVGVHPLVVR